MEANNQDGRNLSIEVDALRGKMNEMSEAQIRMEETLRGIREDFGLAGLNAAAGGGPSNTATPSSLSLPFGFNNNREQMMCSYFLGTLGAPYVGAMAGAAYRDFADLMAAGKGVEMLARTGKLPMDHPEGNRAKKGPQSKNKDTEASYAQPQQSFMPQYGPPSPRPFTPSYPYQPAQFPYQPPQSIPRLNTARPPPFQVNHLPTPYPRAPVRLSYAQYPPAYPHNRPNYQQPRPNFQNPSHPRPQGLPPFPKLSIPISELFQRLFDAHLITESPTRPVQPPYPAWYNPSLSCKYHMGVVGHSIEICDGFKFMVRKLIACGRLDIGGLNIVNNLMPNHGGKGGVNVVEKEGGSNQGGVRRAEGREPDLSRG